MRNICVREMMYEHHTFWCQTRCMSNSFLSQIVCAQQSLHCFEQEEAITSKYTLEQQILELQDKPSSSSSSSAVSTPSSGQVRQTAAAQQQQEAQRQQQEAQKQQQLEQQLAQQQLLEQQLAEVQKQNDSLVGSRYPTLKSFELNAWLRLFCCMVYMPVE